MKHLCFTAAVFAALFAVLFNSGCAGGQRVDPQITAAVTSANVNKVTCDKMSSAQPLNYSDIKNLVTRHVPSHIIVGYLRSTQRVYDFSSVQLAGLKAAGAKPHLLNYLTETEGFYSSNSSHMSGRKVPQDVRDNSKLNQDKQPFFYNAPIVDDWYDSAYTESCYSPFSFN